MLEIIGKSIVFISTLLLCLKCLFQSNAFEVYMYDVGQGDSLRIRMPNGVNMLIDGGPDYTLDRYLSNAFFLSCSIDVLVLTHPHADHLAGLVRYLNRCNPTILVSAFSLYDSTLYQEWEGLIKNSNVITVAKGDTFYFGNVRMEILWPPVVINNSIDSNINNTSVITYFSYRDVDALLLGDAELSALKEINLPEALDILKIPHHGSITGMYIPMYDLHPKNSLISVGKNNQFGHPNYKVLKLLESIKSIVYRTDYDGTVKFYYK